MRSPQARGRPARKKGMLKADRRAFLELRRGLRPAQRVRGRPSHALRRRLKKPAAVGRNRGSAVWAE